MDNKTIEWMYLEIDNFFNNQIQEIEKRDVEKHIKRCWLEESCILHKQIREHLEKNCKMVGKNEGRGIENGRRK